MKLGFLTLFMIFFSCVEVVETEIELEFFHLDLYMDKEKKGNYYIVEYPRNRDHWYTEVYVSSHPNVFVKWDSEDVFCVDFMNQIICEPIIRYSTYTRTDGSGQQMIYLTSDFIGDTLSVIGCIDENVCDELRFIVD